MLKNIFALGAGSVFGLGLALSQMTNPAKVQAFLDVVGAWDPSLIFVMGGAVVVSFFAFRVILRRPAPVLTPGFLLPTMKDIDKRLVGGSALFGIGWGLAGFCPGPAISSLAFGHWQSYLFVAAMVAGFWIARIVSQGTIESDGAQEAAA
ncbi:MAG TPA: YeeE/YedE family protein [Sneathiellales bacterium]|jgi:uncharacterized membrane protein YedE/YeeE|nr:YeeE/YedE family protein [Sneathiellales bacterium]